MWEDTTPSTELPRDFCARIGPLQLGVVLVSFKLIDINFGLKGHNSLYKIYYEIIFSETLRASIIIVSMQQVYV